jgi:transcriptional regulator with XRE-family HTH domain
MSNQRLRAAMTAGGWTNEGLAEVAGVDPKTVERWLNLGRTPHRRIAFAAAAAVDEDVFVLWPQLRQARPTRAVHPELVALHTRRADAPASLWWDLFSRARSRIDVLVYAAVFLHEQHPELNTLLAERASQGCEVRIAIGAPDSERVVARGREERFGDGIESRCRLARLHYAPLAAVAGVEVRQHGTTLYNSIFRADDDMLVNAHLWGANAYAAPLWHLQRAEPAEGSSVFDAYAASFDEIWAGAEPVRADPL